MVIGDSTHHYSDINSWTPIAMMLAEVQNETIPGYLLIQREVGLKAMVPVFREAKEILVELFGFDYVEDTEDGNDGVEFDGHFYL